MAGAPTRSARADESIQAKHGSPIDGGRLQQSITHALEPLIAGIYDQFAQMARQQGDLLVEPARAMLESDLDHVFAAAQRALSRQVNEAVESVLAAMRQQALVALDPVDEILREHMDPILGPRWSASAVVASALAKTPPMSITAGMHPATLPEAPDPPAADIAAPRRRTKARKASSVHNPKRKAHSATNGNKTQLTSKSGTTSKVGKVGKASGSSASKKTSEKTSEKKGSRGTR